ncbi:MAG: transposase [Pirellulales bacterium]
MQTLRDHQSGDLFDPWEYLGPQRRKLLEQSWAGVFRDYLLRHLPVKELAAGFREDFGRPSKDLYVAIGALILQQLHDLTDKQTTEAVALNIAWHYALDIRHESDAYLCERTLRNYRRRLLELGLDEVLFRTLTDRLIEELGVDTSKQRLDSTAVKSAIRGLTRLGLLVEATSKFLRELKRKQPERYAEVDVEIIRKYVERNGEGCFASTRPSESKRRLPEAAEDVHALVGQFRLTSAADLESYELLRRIFDEQCEVANAIVSVRPPRKHGCDGVISPADPDARYNYHRGKGYLVQIMETFVEDDATKSEESLPQKPDLITHVAVDPLTMHDQDALEPALHDTDQRGVKPRELLADSHYGSNECLRKGQEQNVEVVSPSMPPKGKQQGKFTLEDFELDNEGRVLRCPMGWAPEETSVAEVRIQVLFDQKVCAACTRRDACPAAAVGRREQRWQYNHDRVKQRARRIQDASKEFRDRYRWRAGIEATVSRFKHQMGMSQLRVRGMARVNYVATLRALGLNIHRVAVYRAGDGKTGERPSSENATTPKGASDNSPLADLLTEDELHEKTRIVPRDRMFNKSFCRPVIDSVPLSSWK